MATENKEKAKGEAIFPLTQEQINQIAAILRYLANSNCFAVLGTL